VPTRYEKSGSVLTPVYVTYTYQNSTTYDFDAIDSALASISVGVSDKKNIFIMGASISIKDFDEALSNYYAGTKGSLDPYSIRLDESIYSNISNGTGIFGSYKMNSFSFTFDTYYLSKIFGYSNMK
jgi:hypothetical protein